MDEERLIHEVEMSSYLGYRPTIPPHLTTKTKTKKENPPWVAGWAFLGLPLNGSILSFQTDASPFPFAAHLPHQQIFHVVFCKVQT